MIKFIRIRGRVIPIRANVNKIERPTDVSNIVEVKKSRAIVKQGLPNDPLYGAYWKAKKSKAQETGHRIAKRIARFALKGVKKAA